VLIIISQDCFHNAARELAGCPDVAIIQHDSGEYVLPLIHPKCPIFFVVDIMQLAHHYFDCSLYPLYQELYFMACANGEVKPFFAGLRSKTPRLMIHAIMTRRFSQRNLSDRLTWCFVSAGKGIGLSDFHVRSSSRDTLFGWRPILKAASRKVSH
jgi:hypothetical protein